MKVIVVKFMPLLVVFAGALVMMIGGYRGYEIDFDNAWQIAGLLIVVPGMGWAAVQILVTIYKAIRNI